MRRMTMSALVLLLSVASLNGATQDRSRLRPAWEWSLDERIEARLAGSRAGQLQVVDGSDHPEQLLPIELFQRVLDSAASDLTADPENDPRQSYRRRLQQAGVDEREFWSLIARVGSDYATLRRKSLRIERLLASGPGDERQRLEQAESELSWRECAERVRAYRAAGEALGPQRLDQLLYQVVAPGLSMVSARGGYTAQELRAIDRGCL